METKIKILKTYNEVEPYLRIIQKCADQHRNEFGFLASGAYRDQALQGKLWVAIDGAQDFNGYLMFGGVKPYLKVFQMFVDQEHRKKRIAQRLISELEEHGVKCGFLLITARVASELPANIFWEKCGFILVSQVSGGKTTKRIINVRSKDLPVPSLFGDMGLLVNQRIKSIGSIELGNRPVLPNPCYALDLNILFDFLKQRMHARDAGNLFSAAWNNVVKLCVTPEFVSELESTSKELNSDPLLDFARSLPSLNKMNEKDLDSLCLEIHKLVFPNRDKGRKAAKNDRADLRHLAYAIHNKLSGFVTREKAILNARNALLTKYGLDIVSASDFTRPKAMYETKEAYSIDGINGAQLKIDTNSTLPNVDVDTFLKNIGILSISSKDIWQKGVASNKQEHLSVYEDNELVAIGSWFPPLPIVMDFNAFIFIREDYGNAVKLVDHFLEKLFRSISTVGIHRIFLLIGINQIQTRAAALKRGFTVYETSKITSVIKLIKYAAGGAINKDQWRDFIINGKCLLGWGRITSSTLMHSKDVKIRLARQGVLSDDELSAQTNKEGILHAFTFDNFSTFPKVIPYKVLKEQSFIDGANLVTFQHLPSKKLEALVNLIYGHDHV